MSNRASDLSRVLDNVGTAVETLKAADHAVSSLIKLVETAEASVTQAQNSASTITLASATGTVNFSAETDIGANVAGVTDGDTFTVKVGSASAVTVTIADGDGAVELEAKLDAIDNIEASFTSDGYLKIEVTGTDDDLVLANGTNTPLTAFGITAGTFTSSGANSTRTTKAAEFDSIRTQIDQMAKDATFNGINLLQSDSLKVVFNEDSTSSLSIAGVDFDAAGLGITAAVDDFQVDSELASKKTLLTTALNTLRDQAATFGSKMSIVETRQDFTSNLINTLENGAGNLTLADTNMEGANMLALQTRQQLSTTALSMANQADQSVMRLF
jgi:flagellin-like hook-associated protein FlgL